MFTVSSDQQKKMTVSSLFMDIGRRVQHYKFAEIHFEKTNIIMKVFIPLAFFKFHAHKHLIALITKGAVRVLACIFSQFFYKC